MDALDRHELAALADGRAFTTPKAAAAWLVQGEDAADLLQRLSASDLTGLSSTSLRPAIFCDEKGRLVGTALLLATESGIRTLCAANDGERLRSWIEHFIIMEDVEFRALEQLRVFQLLGSAASAAGAAIQGEGGPYPIPLEFGGDALWLCDSPEDASQLVSALVGQGLAVVRDDTARRWNLERGIPTPGCGLDDHFHPLEVGLGRFVSTDKGCYVGQEVLARLRNYDKVRRGLGILRGEGVAPSRHGELRSGAKVIGRIVDAMDSTGGYVAVGTIDLSCPDGALIHPEAAAAGTLSRVPAA
jgi:folate-binding protein YgfZ